MRPFFFLSFVHIIVVVLSFYSSLFVAFRIQYKAHGITNQPSEINELRSRKERMKGKTRNEEKYNIMYTQCADQSHYILENEQNISRKTVQQINNGTKKKMTQTNNILP